MLLSVIGLGLTAETQPWPWSAEELERPKVLQKAENLEVLPNEKCAKIVKNLGQNKFLQGEMCTKQGASRPYFQDSGGPLILKV